ncbi:hypothetical protein SERLADRAFT_367218 [Serpula lacrymans var. lacrymans S7.9]|uniref:F-box domain-containing protein n=1 Tax=Serpula lacrymans var. lacrymans (strain S7.9) TaxID=578457 RepID=F8NP88_SERL9|nr:uncharacterized protein SERLADRAFT_367218 [Serpula lacrymans var. lacrymans S7.9]EGO27653.1 hypothetical protein SERLADRAFT_367218 [Serpula lacrymans var. lacrymans S7.9]
MTTTFESLPVELIAEILSELDLASLIEVSYLSRRLRFIASDSSLNPWRRPIIRNLYNLDYENCLKHLSVRTIVPRQNWIEVLSLATPSFLLFDATLPNLRAVEWEECFRRRFLPGWTKWKKDSSWREAFLKVLHRVWHRSHTSCTTDESWTKYVVLNRNGSANELEGSSRSFNPLVIFNEMKLQSNLAHLETRVRLVVEFPDVRIIALGVLNRPKTQFTVNANARAFLHPPGIEATSQAGYDRLTYPLPSHSYRDYPFYTPGGSDKRWMGSGALEEEGMQWVGGLMLTTQIIGSHTRETIADGPPLQEMDIVTGAGRNQYASFSWQDLLVIAPWMQERVSKIIYGPGLGN